MRYEYSITEKYVTLKCAQGCKFNFWFQNRNGQDMKTFFESGYSKKAPKIMQSKKDSIDITYFRSINQNHEKHKHRDVRF